MTIAGTLVAAMVGVAAGMAAFTFDFAEGTSYLSNDPRACVNCHVMRTNYDGWQHGSHHAHATCNDCHVPQDVVGKYLTKIDHGYRHSKGFTFQDFHEPIRMKDSSRGVVEQNCVRCHGALTGDLMIAHGEEPIGSSSGGCLHCHAAVGHGPRR